MKKILSLFYTLSFFPFLLFIPFAASQRVDAQETPHELKPVKYVFLFIGDGMAAPQIEAAEAYRKQTWGEGLTLTSFPFSTPTTTHSADAEVTDSAAAGTAIACGEKTNNGMLGVLPDGTWLESIAERAKKNGRKVGIISSVTVNHATPAAFYAHADSRNSEYSIGLDLLHSGFDYFGGGGVAKRNDRNAENFQGDIYEIAEEKGYTVIRDHQKIRELKPEAGKEQKIMALPVSGALPYAIDGNLEGLRLADFTKQAIGLLDNPNGFFLMVEGGQIDWACHDNDAATALQEVIEFDVAVSIALDFAKTKPDEVLIIVTGDHETGGLNVNDTKHLALLRAQPAAKAKIQANLEKLIKEDEDNAPQKMFETWLEQLGWQKNRIIYNTRINYLVVPKLVVTEEDWKLLYDDFITSQTAILGSGDGKDKAVRTMIRLSNNKVGLSWRTGGHSALPVTTFGWGNQAGQVIGNIKDNTDISKQLKQTVGVLAP